MNWADRLDAAVRAVENPCLLGLDPHLDLLPPEFAVARDESAPRAKRATALAAFCTELVDVARGRIAVVKPQIAFFEIFGADGMSAWEEVVAHAHRRGLLVIGDVKRGDISSTAAAYARAFFQAPGADPACACDAITLNPYLGTDSVAPFLEACERDHRGIYVLVRTSNPSSGELQLHGAPPLWRVVAAALERWGEETVGECGYSAVGAVVGATHADELAGLRQALPRAPLLLPGYGAQGAGASPLAAAFVDAEHRWRGGLINASRSIAFAYRQAEYQDLDWRDAAREAIDAMIGDVRGALGIPSSPPVPSPSPRVP